MATTSQIESADVPPWRRKKPKKRESARGGSTFLDPAIVPGSLEACAIDLDLIDRMREKIDRYARDEEDRAFLLSVILDE